MSYEVYLNKGVYIRFKNEKGEEKELVGVLEDYRPPQLFISSRGNKYTINESQIIICRPAKGRVDP